MNNLKLTIILLIMSSWMHSSSQNNIDLFVLKKQYAEALSAIETQEKINPTASLYFKKGIVYSQLQDYKKALEAYSNALQLDPDNGEIWGEMADGLSVMGNYHDAEKCYIKAIELDSLNLSLAGKLGKVYINQKQIKNAYDVFLELYQKDSSNVFWNKQLAYCSFRMQRRKQAVYLYEKVLEDNPRDYSTYSNLVHIYDRVKEAKKIIALLDSALMQFPGDAGLLLDQANFYFRSKNYERAMIEFEKYYEAGGDRLSEIEMNYGISCFFAPDIDKAFEVFTELFNTVPNDPFVMYYLSMCQNKLKNFEEAEKIMLWAIEASVPEYLSKMYHQLGQIYGQQRKFKESLEALKKVYELNPQETGVLFEIATTYEEFNSNKTLALNYYRLYLEEAGEGAENINYALGRITKLKEDLFFEEVKIP